MDEPTVVVTVPLGQAVTVVSPPPGTTLDVEVLGPNSVRVAVRAVPILPPPQG